MHVKEALSLAERLAGQLLLRQGSGIADAVIFERDRAIISKLSGEDLVDELARGLLAAEDIVVPMPTNETNHEVGQEDDGDE